MLAIVATLGLALTSCEDEDIAYTLEGTWEGNTYMYSYYNNAYYQSTYSYVDFSRDPFTYTSGTGHWIDYYSNAPWDYVANHIYWWVDNGVINIHFEEDNYTIYLYRALPPRRQPLYGHDILEPRQRPQLRPGAHELAQLEQLHLGHRLELLLCPGRQGRQSQGSRQRRATAARVQPAEHRPGPGGEIAAPQPAPITTTTGGQPHSKAASRCFFAPAP